MQSLCYYLIYSFYLKEKIFIQHHQHIVSHVKTSIFFLNIVSHPHQHHASVFARHDTASQLELNIWIHFHIILMIYSVYVNNVHWWRLKEILNFFSGWKTECWFINLQFFILHFQGNQRTVRHHGVGIIWWLIIYCCSSLRWYSCIHCHLDNNNQILIWGDVLLRYYLNEIGEKCD